MPGSRYELFTLPLPFVLWYIVFRVPPFGFWPTLSLAALLLFLTCMPRLKGMGFRITRESALVAIISPVLLYLFFWGGYQVARTIPGFVQTISSVYNLRGGTSTAEISLLLLFPIGPTEELYWRGLVQRALKERTKPVQSLFVTTIMYTFIHLPTLNPSLLAVAFVGGLVWGWIYNRYESVVPTVISHVIFDELIFVLFVIG